MKGDDFVRDYRAEILTALAFVGGWLSITAGVAALTVPEVWPISAGLLLITAAGWGMLARIAREGLYTLTRDPDEDVTDA